MEQVQKEKGQEQEEEKGIVNSFFSKKEVIKMDLDIKQSEGKKKFGEEFDRYKKDIVAKKDRINWENG